MLKDYCSILGNVLKEKILPGNRPFICTYIVTWRCNAKCVMCRIWEKEKTQEMNTQEIATVFRKIKNIKVLRITGGEPFLREDLVGVVNTITENTSVQILHVTTNGILRERIISFIKSVKFDKIHLKISLNGYGDNHDRIMGVAGAYRKAVDTIKELKILRKDYKFVLAINQTIVDKKSYEDSKKIRALCSEYGISYLPVIACNNMALYDPDEKVQKPKTNFEPFGDFSNEDFRIILKDLMAETAKINNCIERVIKRYYLGGLYNRLILNKNKPSPNCVALRNHVRILPDGKVPVCLFNPVVAGDLLKDDFHNIWNSTRVKELRKWVGRCSGCWDECETIPNAIYSTETIRYVIPFLFNSH